jgi:hypothetical protein
MQQIDGNTIRESGKKFLTLIGLLIRQDLAKYCRSVADECAIFIAENPHLTVQEFINGLVKLGDEWGGSRPQDDDVTFVVVKVK